MKNKKWTVRFETEDGDCKYVSVVGADAIKVLQYICKAYEVEPTAIDYMSADEINIID